ncbi:YfcZ/YiiS family protein [Vibrio methylphosphonaticus]|uniref:YfcZ/YiiS family protein n=1 Tax=Vibrio methylphosphonaticus TaxID=2946866 RepID=UPI00202A9F5C|nr:YfcZ/YiiS family protein [Vibrio methylphosphonaticus]MCL9773878.1 YfcZ/YiiS family protein [Vibrio methylphosphonaticus]
MSNTYKEEAVCDACGVSGEMGFIIKEGDDVAEVQLFAESKALLEQEIQKYIDLAQSVSKEVQYDISALEEDSTELQARFKFEVSAEKLIFELKTRSISR